jgi:hypothetical protein
VNSVVSRMRAPAVSLGLFATTLGFTEAIRIQGRIDFYKDILNGYEVMGANPLPGGDGKRGRKADPKDRIAVIEV